MTDERLNHVDAALRRWRTSAVSLEYQGSADARRARTLATIASAMRQGQFDRQRAKRGRLWAVGLVAASVLIGVGAWTLASSESTASVAVERAVLAGESGKTWLWSGAHKQPVEVGAERALRIGDRILTDSGSARLRVGSTRIAVAKQSEVVLSQNRSDLKSVTLRGGFIDVDVEPSRDGRVEVETPHARIVVHGTQFSVAVSQPDEDAAVTNVRVRRGVVAVIRGGREVARLKAGDSWTSKKAAPKPVNPAESLASDAKAPLQQAKRAPVKRAIKQGLSRPATKSVEVVDASTLAEQNQMFRRAVDARNRGDDEQALKNFDALLGKFPKSALAQEARVERFRALKRLGKNREAAQAARRYLMDHTNGFAKDEARDLALTPDAAGSK